MTEKKASEHLNPQPEIRSDEAGFTLIEIMIAAGIAIVVAFALAEVLVTSTKQEASIKMKQELYNFLQQQKYENKVVAPPSPSPTP